MFRPARIKTKVVFKTEVNEKLFIIRFSLDRPSQFSPGQFLNIEIERGIQRSYSVLSSPSDDYLDIVVDTHPGGKGSVFLDNLKVSDEINIIFPLGNFWYLNNVTPVWFVATGTGIAPFFSMINYELNNIKSGREIHLVYGNRTEADTALISELREIERKYPNFILSLCTSREENENSYFGRVSKFMSEALFDIQSDFYLCGGREMILDVEKILVDKGVESNRIKYEQFYE